MMIESCIHRIQYFWFRSIIQCSKSSLLHASPHPLAWFLIPRPQAVNLMLFSLRGSTVNTAGLQVQNYSALEDRPRAILRKRPSKWVVLTAPCWKHILSSKEGALQPSAATGFGLSPQLHFGAHFHTSLISSENPQEGQGVGKLWESAFSEGDVHPNPFRGYSPV